MSKYKKGNGHHLTLSDRIYIEQELFQNTPFRRIALALDKDPSTISKEVRLHRYSPQNSVIKYPRCSRCISYDTCYLSDRIFNDKKNLSYLNSNARDCKQYNPFHCKRLNQAPYVCNGCSNKSAGCTKPKQIYEALRSQREYEKKLSECRQGINMTPQELKELDELISPLVLKGQPLSHIFAVHSDDIPICRRTLYNYFDKRVFRARNIDLPRRVRYKRRKKTTAGSRARNINQVYRNKRTYKDFERFISGYPDSSVVEMDTVKGNVSSGKCLLTLLFRSCNFMIVILLPRCTQKCVINAINNLTETISLRLFRKYFRVILTDNGPEFKNPWDIETTPDGKHRTYVFYCDPYVSNQKAKIEKNHEYIRYVIPKGRSMNRYNQEDINLMASHINSTARDSLNGASPFDLAELLLDKRIPALVGQHKVSPDSIQLKPALLNK